MVDHVTGFVDSDYAKDPDKATKSSICVPKNTILSLKSNPIASDEAEKDKPLGLEMKDSDFRSHRLMDWRRRREMGLKGRVVVVW
nr:hypothetical protein [Tanacetum cinerariifolium]